jgi:hypothetical protein
MCGCGTIPTLALWCMVHAYLRLFESGSSLGGVFFLSHHPLLPVKILALTLPYLGIVRKVYHHMSYPSTCHINAPHATFHSIPNIV